MSPACHAPPYLATSSFEYGPGVPVFRSTDLRAWRQVGHALPTAEHLDLSEVTPSSGVLAPTLRHHDGRFWLITTNLSDAKGQLVVHATDPAGPWSAPVRFPTLDGIDPDLAWDDDGRCYLSYAGFGPHGSEGIQQVEVDLERGDVLTSRRHLWSGAGGKLPEAPHLYHVGPWWYLLIAEGGTERGHAASIARAPSPSGPFGGFPGNPLLTRRGTDSPVQSTGHADLVERPDGCWAVVYHGVPARRSSPEWHVLGRETYADEVEWRDGWPVLGRHIEPALTPDVVIREDLATAELPLAWVAPGRFARDVMVSEPAGWRIVHLAGEPVVVGRRQQHLHAAIRASLDVGAGVGGVSLRVDPRHELALECDVGEVRAVLTIGEVRTVLATRPLAPGAVLEIRALPSDGPWWSTARGPDRVEVGVREAGAFVLLASVDGRYLSTEVAGGMTGRVFAVTCTAGSLLIRRWTYLGADDPDALTAALE